MRKLLILLLLLVTSLACSSDEAVPATVLARPFNVTAISIEMDIVEILEYGHYMHQINIGNRIEAFTTVNYEDSLHLIGSYKEFQIKHEYGYWEIIN